MQVLLLSLVTSGLVILQTIQSQGLASNLEPEEDVLEEAVADGFLVELKATLSPDKYEKQKTTTLNSLIADVSPSLPPLGESMPTIHDDFLLVIASHEAGTELTTENPKDLAKNGTLVKTPILPLAGNTEGSGDFPDSMITDIHTRTTLTKKEPVTGMDDTTDRGSGMVTETLYEEQKEDSVSTTTVTKEYFSSSTFLSLPPEVTHGSGMGSEVTTFDSVTTKATVVVEKVPETTVNTEQDPEASNVADIEPTVKASFRPRLLAPRDPEPTISARAEKRTPDWLIIFAVCLTIGAILCVLAAIATKDSWYGPCRQRTSAAPTPSNEEYDKKSTLPLSEKEQHLLTLMGTEKEERNKDFTIIGLEEVTEKEYLM